MQCIAPQQLPNCSDRMAGKILRPDYSTLRTLKANYVFEGPICELLFKENLKIILSRIPSSAQVFTIGCNEHHINAHGEKSVLSWRVDVNNWWRLNFNLLQFFCSTSVRLYGTGASLTGTIQTISTSLYISACTRRSRNELESVKKRRVHSAWIFSARPILRGMATLTKWQTFLTSAYSGSIHLPSDVNYSDP
jgi:hypothetical protein